MMFLRVACQRAMSRQRAFRFKSDWQIKFLYPYMYYIETFELKLLCQTHRASRFIYAKHAIL